MLSEEKFKESFSTMPAGFEDPVMFVDGVLGLSVLKDRGDGYASMFKIYIRETEMLKSDPIKMLECAVSYGKRTENGITLSSSTEKIRGMFDPLDLLSTDEFSLDSSTNKFFYKGKEIEPQEILEELEKLHLKVTKTVKGMWLKTKIVWFHYILTRFWKIIFGLVATLQYLTHGERVKIFDKINPEDKSRSLFNVPEKSLDINKGELIDLWGYKVKPWIAYLYALLHLIAYFIFFFNDYRPEWVLTLFRSSFLTFMYGIVSLGLANALLPILLKPIKLKKLLKKVQSLYGQSAFRRVRI